jgi:hypothetical protein
MNQLFTTLGQLTAVLVSGSVAVPMVSYYNGNNLTKWDFLNPNYWTKRTNESKLKLRVDGELFVDGDIRCSGDVLAFCKRS